MKLWKCCFLGSLIYIYVQFNREFLFIIKNGLIKCLRFSLLNLCPKSRGFCERNYHFLLFTWDGTCRSSIQIRRSSSLMQALSRGFPGQAHSLGNLGFIGVNVNIAFCLAAESQIPRGILERSPHFKFILAYLHCHNLASSRHQCWILPSYGDHWSIGRSRQSCEKNLFRLCDPCNSDWIVC